MAVSKQARPYLTEVSKRDLRIMWARPRLTARHITLHTVNIDFFLVGFLLFGLCSVFPLLVTFDKIAARVWCVICRVIEDFPSHGESWADVQTMLCSVRHINELCTWKGVQFTPVRTVNISSCRWRLSKLFNFTKAKLKNWCCKLPDFWPNLKFSIHFVNKTFQTTLSSHWLHLKLHFYGCSLSTLEKYKEQ